MNSIQDTRYVYICSASYSGSTLLDMLIGSHPECESLGEVVLLPVEFAMNRACRCGSNIRECALWSEVALRLDVNTESNPCDVNLGYLNIAVGDSRLRNLCLLTLARLRYGLSYYRFLYKLKILDAFASKFDEGIQNTFKVYDIVRTIARKHIVVDSSKHHTRAAALYVTRPEFVRIIYLIRDGRGVFHSGLKRGFSRRRSLDAWCRHHAHALPLLQKRVDPKHLMQVRYEDLVANPQQILSEVCQFLLITYDPAMIDFQAVVHHNVDGNAMKYVLTPGINLNEAWKAHLSKSDLEYFERKAGSINRQFGYH